MIPASPGAQVCAVWDWSPAQIKLPHIRFPTQAQVYTVREIIRPSPLMCNVDYYSYLLEEIINEKEPGAFHEPSFNVQGFRPVKRTSIEEFKSILVPTPKKLERV